MRALLLTSVALAMLAIAAPDLVESYLGSRNAGEVRDRLPDSADPQARSAADMPGQVELAAEDDGHFYVDAEVNFEPVRLLVDTGATVTALRQSDAEAAGLRLIAADFDQPVMTANGTAYAAVVELDSVVVDSIEVSGVRAVVLPDGQLSVSLLGGSFLNRLARFEVADGTLIFEN